VIVQRLRRGETALRGILLRAFVLRAFARCWRSGATSGVDGGHNAGIVSEAGHPGRSYQIATKRATDKYEDLDTWLNKCLEGRRFLVPGVGAMAGRGLATILIVVFALMAVDEFARPTL